MILILAVFLFGLVDVWLWKRHHAKQQIGERISPEWIHKYDELTKLQR